MMSFLNTSFQSLKKSVRSWLKKEEFLSLDFPIVEMPWTDDMSNYLGMCHFSSLFQTGAEAKSGKSGLIQRVERVSIRLRSKPVEAGCQHESCESTQEKPQNSTQSPTHFHLLRLIPTLLHEFAHATAETSRPLLEEPETTIRKRKMKKFDHFSHDDFFYAHFRRILKAAELLGIYRLPNSSNKYNTPSLRRFDQVDMEVCPLNFCGSSKLYDGNVGNVVGDLDRAELVPSIVEASTALNLTLINPKGVRKLVILKDLSFDSLKEQSAKKYQKKGGFKLFDSKGVELTEETFSSVQNGDTLHVH